MKDAATFDLAPILARLAAIYRRTLALHEEASADADDPIGHMASVADLADKPIPSRLNGVRDGRTGMDYAAWVIGETLCAVGGFDLMQRVFDAFDDRHGTRAAVWLDHRWNGVQVGGDVWCA